MMRGCLVIWWWRFTAWLVIRAMKLDQAAFKAARREIARRMGL